MPSFTFSSTAGAFALHGARIVFVDIRPDTMNMDESLIEPAITDRTRAIVVMHYAGVACEMDRIMALAESRNIVVIEDAAQSILAGYKGRSLGTIGHLGCFSFHETKNIQCGEGGALIINDMSYFARAEIIREKGTDRSKFFRGEVDKYGWVDIGSSFLPSELNAAFLYAQLLRSREITDQRLHSWGIYRDGLERLSLSGRIDLPHVPPECRHNAHMFYIKTADLDERTGLIEHLRKREVHSVFHYIPLHTSKAGLKAGRFSGDDRWTTRESERLLRLPMYYGLGEKDVIGIVDAVNEFYSK
jgi:dTDP-4-amino-4,6-dideoxygalactose transaminase